MIDITSRLDILNFWGLRVLQELGFNPAIDQRFSLEVVVGAVTGIVECLDEGDISNLVVAGGIPTADVYATRAWTEWFPGTVGRHAAALAIIAHLSEMIA